MSEYKESVNRDFLPMGEKVLKIETLYCMPEKLTLARLLSAFILEHNIDASCRGIRYLDSPVVFIYSQNSLEDAECKQ